MELTVTSIVILLQHIIIGVTGCVGNVFVLVVYLKRLNDNEISTLFILYLAITDLVCCLILVPINCYVELLDLQIQSDFLCKFHSFLNISNITYSCFLMTLVAFERYFSIIWPLHKIISKLRAKVLTAILLVVCLALALLGSLGVGIDHRATFLAGNFTFLNETRGYLRPSMHENNTSHQLNDVWLRTNDCFHNDAIIKRDVIAYIRLIQNSLPVICFFIIFFLYATIYISVSKRRKMKKDREAYYQQIVRRSRQYSTIHNHTIMSTATNRTSIATNAGNNGAGSARQSFLDIPNNNNNTGNNSVTVSRNDSCASLTNYSPIQQYQPITTPNSSSNNATRSKTQPLYIPAVEEVSSIMKHSSNEFEMEPINLYKRAELAKLKQSRSTSSILDYPVMNDRCKSDDQLSNNKQHQTSPTKASIQPRTSLLASKSNQQIDLENSHTDVSNLSPQHEPLLISSNNNNASYASKPLQLQKANGLAGISSAASMNPNAAASTLMANLKTAFMLFIVTVIMSIVFTPALLISFNVIPFNPVFWNLYFINNACNPIVYSFLNANFRNTLKGLLCGSLISRQNTRQ